MNTVFEITVLIISVFSVVQCCWIRDSGQFSCQTVQEVHFEGNDTWTNLNVQDDNKRNQFKKDSFKRTPNLMKLSIKNFDSIEKGTFNGLTNLDNLELYQFKGEEFPVGVIDDLPIRRLTMNDFDITHILPGLFDNVPDLGILSMYRNKVTEIKKGVFNGTSILKIYIDDNLINKVEPGAFEDMPQLLHLSFTGNKFTTFNSAEAFGMSDSVNRVWLDKNKLKTIEKTSFSAFPYLTKLNLDLNEIEFIENGAFDNNQLLDFLDLSNNKLTEFHPQVFPAKGLPKLLVIHLHMNKLTFLHKSVLLKASKLQYISFGGNPIQCVCSVKINEWIKQRNIEVICDNELDTGNRPSCVSSKIYPDDCLYDTQLTQDLYKMYIDINEGNPIKPTHCDTTKGADHAFINNY